MIKNKSIILPFLFLAWTIIFVHSVIPHHHHDTFHETKCLNDHHEHEHAIQLSEFAEIHDCDSDCSDHACHFQVEILTQVSIDNIFICPQENYLYSDVSCVKTNHPNFYKDIISEDFPKTNYLRGPPSIA